MSHDEAFQEPSSGKTFEPLKPTTTRSEAVDMGGAEPAGKTFEPLNPTTTRTEPSTSANSTPMVVEEGDDQSEGSPAQLKGEVRSLRSRNQILRAERTSIAGRKYALEVVVENLKEKLEALAELCDQINAPGELGQALAGIREMVGEARAIAAGKGDALDADFESERAAQLQRYQAMETKVSELNEQTAGYRAERDALREQATAAERSLAQVRGELFELQDFKARAMETIDDAVGEGRDQEQRLESLQVELDALRAELEATREQATRVAEAESAVEALRRDNQAQRESLAEAEELARTADERAQRAAASSGKVQQLEHDLEQAMRQAEASHDLANRVEVERDAALAAVEEAANTIEKHEATLAELREALKEIKPVLDELDSENRRLARLVGEARDRGRVNIDELLAREKLLRKLERLANG